MPDCANEPNGKDLVEKIQQYVYAIRRGKIEKVLAAAVVALPTLAAYLRKEWTSQADTVLWGSLFLEGVLLSWLVLRLWKRAVPPPRKALTDVPNAVKGLLPFTAADGKLFSDLGRRNELQSLVGLAQDPRNAISVVRGESGAGKTSLLQAGLEYTLKEQTIYWEAVALNPADGLLHAVSSRFSSLTSLDMLPNACPEHCILILDQFEQMRAEVPEHKPIFELLERIAVQPPPHRLSAVVGFHQDYTHYWLDFEDEHGFRAERISIKLLAPPVAKDVLVTLATSAEFSLDEAMVENFVKSVTQTGGVSPIDIAIGVLSLANFVQQQGGDHVGMAEYELAGGSEGLLLAFAQEKLHEIPEPLRVPLLKGLVLSLVDFSSNQRIATGKTAAEIASKVDVEEAILRPWLDRLAHPRVRLLERIERGPNLGQYRIPHERLVPVFRRLAGQKLAELDKLRLSFESEYQEWRKTGARRRLLLGSDLKAVVRSPDEFVKGEDFAGRTEFIRASLRQRNSYRLLAAGLAICVVVLGYALYSFWHESIQKQELVSWGLPRGLYEVQHRIDQL